MLDAAAPHADTLPTRDDITYFVAHPCHPPLFNDETDMDAKTDYFGGIAAKQHIVCALAQGPEEHYAKCEEIARVFYGPVMRSHRVTVEQMALLEPALSESVGATFAKVLKDATDEAARRGIPYQAAEDFLLGHLTILLAVAFGVQPGGKLSDGCMKAIEEAEPVIFKDGWMDEIFSAEAVKASVKSICNLIACFRSVSGRSAMFEREDQLARCSWGEPSYSFGTKMVLIIGGFAEICLVAELPMLQLRVSFA